MNALLHGLIENDNVKTTTNGAVAYKSTLSAVYDMFAFGGAYRQRSDEDCILLFKNALEENETLALKCLFYLRDCRGGQGERRFFRVCYKWLANEYSEIARRNMEYISEYGRIDDMIYSLYDTKLRSDVVSFIKTLLALDLDCKTPSLLAKWMPSENASAPATKEMANKLRCSLGMSHKQYRQTLSKLRARINVVERLMSANRWSEIEFDKIPSKAGLIYKNAFARRDIIAKKYEKFIKSDDTKVNASTLYPYEVLNKALKETYNDVSDTERIAVQKYWDALPDYFDGNSSNILCVVDTSGSMAWGEGNIRPIDVAISLGIYCGERNCGAFKDYFISFASRPQLIRIEGVDIADKASRIYEMNLIDNTNLEAVFDLLLDTIKSKSVSANEIPERIIVISDMEIDEGTVCRYSSNWGNFPKKPWTKDTSTSLMESIRKEWELFGVKMPGLVYWNVNARNNTILDMGENVSFVSGCSPVIMEQILKGISGIEIMLDKLNSDRYKDIK